MVTFSLAPAALPRGQRVYAVGDVHGCADRLAALHAQIAVDLKSRPVSRTTLVHLGDYVDRGPDSAGVLTLVSGGPPVSRVVNLMGNHEAMMLDAVTTNEPEAVKHWLQNGGGQTLASWGIPADSAPHAWNGRIPPAEINRLRNLPLSHAEGGYFFVHAGIRPGIPPARQTSRDMLWIREPFLSHASPFGAVVVHGHTPAAEPVVRPNRIGIDTGAVLGGRLTCLVLEETRMAFLSA